MAFSDLMIRDYFGDNGTTLKVFYAPPSSVFIPDSLRRHFRDARDFDIHEKAFASASVGPTPIFNVGSMTHR